jgi:hypothetical protein
MKKLTLEMIENIYPLTFRVGDGMFTVNDNHLHLLKKSRSLLLNVFLSILFFVVVAFSIFISIPVLQMLTMILVSLTTSNEFVGLQDFHTHGFLEVGAAALLVGDMEAKNNDQQWKYSVIQEFPDIDLLQPSTSTPSTFASSQSHLKAITAPKRMKSGPNQAWYTLFIYFPSNLCY